MIQKIHYCFFIFVLFFIGCQTTAPLTPQQRRSLQVKVFSSVSYNTVFRAFKTVMQDEGYIITNQDFKGGLIVAESQKAPVIPNGEFMSIVAMGILSGSRSQRNYRTGHTYSWSVNLEEIQKNTVETRLILQRKDFYSGGGRMGKEILEPEIYRNIFIKTQREIERRKALKRK